MIDSDKAFFERQTPIIDAIGGELIELTPEHWREAVLEIRVEVMPDGTQAMAHTILSPEGHRELVTPGDHMFELTRRLYLLFAEYEQPWRRATCRVHQAPDESWRISVDYAYHPTLPSPALRISPPVS